MKNKLKRMNVMNKHCEKYRKEEKDQMSIEMRINLANKKSRVQNM